MPDNLTDKQLKWGYWWVLHRAALHRLVVAFLIITSLTLCGYALWQVTDWLTNRKAEEEALKQLVNQTLEVGEYRRTNRPQNLELGLVTAVPSSRGLYDLVAEVKNINVNWAITDLVFTFTADGQAFSGNSFMLPLEDKYVVKLGIPFRNKPKQVSVSFSDIKWRRVKNLSEFSVPTFNISNQKVESVTPVDASVPIATSLTFDIENSSPYSYWQVELTVILTKSGSIQAVGQQIISSVYKQSTRQVEFYWPESQITADNLIIRPEVNVLDPRVLM